MFYSFYEKLICLKISTYRKNNYCRARSFLACMHPVNSRQPVTHNFFSMPNRLLNVLYIPKDAVSAVLILFPNRTKIYNRLLSYTSCLIKKFHDFIRLEFSLHFSYLTLNIPSLAHQRCLSSWGPRRTPWFFFVISQMFDAVDYSNYVFWVSETIIQ